MGKYFQVDYALGDTVVFKVEIKAPTGQFISVAAVGRISGIGITKTKDRETVAYAVELAPGGSTPDAKALTVPASLIFGQSHDRYSYSEAILELSKPWDEFDKKAADSENAQRAAEAEAKAVGTAWREAKAAEAEAKEAEKADWTRAIKADKT